jgi:uncharacterized protein (TIGR02145 family)
MYLKTNKMKKIFTLGAAILLTASVFSQAPQKMSYQAVIRNSSNTLVINTQVGMQISILQGAANGTAVYVETQTPTSNANGLVSLEVGAGTVVSGAFASINWANGPYFIKTETDSAGGTNYTITGTSQFLSVPYALHSKTAETLTGTITESDPLFGASVAAGITAADTAQWNIDNDPTNEIQQFSVSSTGDTLYLQNGGFVIIPGISAANPPLPQYPAGSIFCATGPTAIVNVTNPTTGRVWMDRNLGASQAATSSTDTNSYGDLYQWGRRGDGHQCRTSPTTSTLSSVDQPTNGSFILSPNAPYDWRSPQNTNLWQGVNGVNNPCPSGYCLPTEAELNAERLSWTSNDRQGAFASTLKLPVAGNRSHSSGSLGNVGTNGYYWGSTVNGVNSQYLVFYNSNALMNDYYRANGFSVRCIKD